MRIQTNLYSTNNGNSNNNKWQQVHHECFTRSKKGRCAIVRSHKLDQFQSDLPDLPIADKQTHSFQGCVCLCFFINNSLPQFFQSMSKMFFFSAHKT